MNILYITPLLPKGILAQVLKKDSTKYAFAPQRFHRNLVEGFIANGHSVQVLSTLPSCIDFMTSYIEDGVLYTFIPFIDQPGIKHFQVAKGVFNKIRRDRFLADLVICDTLNISMCLGALAARVSKRTKLLGIVTDLPDSISKYEHGFLYRASSRISSWYIKSFDYYVFLTAQMNDVVNPNKRPYIIMEGVCDLPGDGYYDGQRQRDSATKRKLLYAGGRPIKDGIETLISAFKLISGSDLELNLYGSLPDVKIGRDPDDPRIIYHGKTENSIISKDEYDSYLLINPRPTEEDYTKYSFPSKLMEYMATGTPVVTTRLAGIPTEYFEYVYVFEECTVECFHSVLCEILSRDREMHFSKGDSARAFVLNNKNKVIQTRRILSLYGQ